MSIVFDRAVEYYDQTRALPEWRHKALIEALVRETAITRDSRVLEVGIGTGRIGLSVAEHVRRLFGVDLSTEMMAVLRRKLAQTNLAIDLTLADALHLPFGDNLFDVAYAVHVFHLVKDWQDALQDVQRILKPGGSFVASFHRRDSNSPNLRLRAEMRALAQQYGVDTRRPGSQSEEELYAEIQKWGSPPRIVEVSAWREAEVPEDILKELDRQIFSETWMIPRPVMDRLMPRLREWAVETFGDLHKPVEAAYATRWMIAIKRRAA